VSGSYSRVRIASSHCALLITLVVAHPSTRTPQQTPRAPHPVGGGSPEVGRRDDVNARTHKRWLGMHERGGWRLEVGGRHSTVSCMFVGLVHQCTNEGTSSQRRRKPHRRKRANERPRKPHSRSHSLLFAVRSFVRSRGWILCGVTNNDDDDDDDDDDVVVAFVVQLRNFVYGCRRTLTYTAFVQQFVDGSYTAQRRVIVRALCSLRGGLQCNCWVECDYS